uniref:Uncharacterized protein n=1 Tax=Glossina brevipalpis TaxID=37001 RepID=A0A1A9W8D1_9MUSC
MMGYTWVIVQQMKAQVRVTKNAKQQWRDKLQSLWATHEKAEGIRRSCEANARRDRVFAKTQSHDKDKETQNNDKIHRENVRMYIKVATSTKHYVRLEELLKFDAAIVGDPDVALYDASAIISDDGAQWFGECNYNVQVLIYFVIVPYIFRNPSVEDFKATDIIPTKTSVQQKHSFQNRNMKTGKVASNMQEIYEQQIGEE